MSVFTYNGVTIPYCKTTNFSEEAVFDDSNTDRIYTKFDITVQGVLNFNYLSQIAPDLITLPPVVLPSTTNPAEIASVIRSRLLKPRRALSMTFNGKQLITQPQDGLTGTVDAHNGPHPQTCTLSELTNTTYLVTFRIIAEYWENLKLDGAGNILFPTINKAGSTVLSNRWSETATINGLNLTMFKRSGKYIIRSDNAEGLTIDNLRIRMAVVAPYDGFLRQRSEYRVDPSGLAIEYYLEDLEQYKMPPAGAFTAEGEYTESGNTMGLNVRYGEARVRLQGDNNTSQSKLLEIAIDIVTSKLLARGRDLIGLPILFPRVGTLMDTMARIDLYRNEVEFRARVWFDANPLRINTLASFAGISSTFTPLSDNIGSTTPNYLPYGTAGILLEAAAYQDPNLTDNFLRFDGSLSRGQLPGTAGRTPEA